MKRVRGLALFLFVLIAFIIFICIFDIYINSFNSEVQTVVTISEGKRIEGTYIKGDEGLNRGVILLHDKGCERANMTALASAFNKEGYHVLYYDLPGHGSSEGVFTDEYIYNGRLETILSDVIDQLVKITELEKKDISFVGAGIGARTLLSYSANGDERNDLYLIRPYVQREDVALDETDLVNVGRKDNVLILYSNFDKEYNDYIIPVLYERITNREFDRTQSRNISVHGNVEVSRVDMVLKAFETNSNSMIKKIIFTASIKQGFELTGDYFNTRSILFFTIIILLLLQGLLLHRAFKPNMPSTKIKKTPYEFGIKRLLWTIIILGIYIIYSLYIKKMIKISLTTFYENLLVIFIAYGLTGLLSLKYKKVVRLGDHGISAAVSILVGIAMISVVGLWLYMGYNTINFFQTKLIYFIVTMGCAWIALYFYALDYSVMYMMGASERVQKLLIRFVFMLPFIFLIIISYLKETPYLGRDILQYVLVFVCIYFTEGLQKLGNKMIYSSFFGAALYAVITITNTIYI